MAKAIRFTTGLVAIVVGMLTLAMFDPELVTGFLNSLASSAVDVLQKMTDGVDHTWGKVLVRVESFLVRKAISLLQQAFTLVKRAEALTSRAVEAGDAEVLARSPEKVSTSDTFNILQAVFRGSAKGLKTLIEALHSSHSFYHVQQHAQWLQYLVGQSRRMTDFALVAQWTFENRAIWILGPFWTQRVIACANIVAFMMICRLTCLILTVFIWVFIKPWTLLRT